MRKTMKAGCFDGRGGGGDAERRSGGWTRMRTRKVLALSLLKIWKALLVEGGVGCRRGVEEHSGKEVRGGEEGDVKMGIRGFWGVWAVYNWRAAALSPL